MTFDRFITGVAVSAILVFAFSCSKEARLKNTLAVTVIPQESPVPGYGAICRVGVDKESAEGYDIHMAYGGSSEKVGEIAPGQTWGAAFIPPVKDTTVECIISVSNDRRDGRIEIGPETGFLPSLGKWGKLKNHEPFMRVSASDSVRLKASEPNSIPVYGSDVTGSASYMEYANACWLYPGGRDDWNAYVTQVDLEYLSGVDAKDRLGYKVFTGLNGEVCFTEFHMDPAWDVLVTFHLRRPLGTEAEKTVRYLLSPSVLEAGAETAEE